MSLSRTVHLFKTINSVRKPIYGQLIQQSRNSAELFSYRRGGYPPSKFSHYGANILQGFMWWWILWHFWHEPEHIFGEHPWPNPEQWTDEELGIPPDDSD